MTRWIVPLFLLASAAAAQDAPPVGGPTAPVLEALTTGIVEKRDIRIGPGERNSEPPVLWTGELAVQNSAYLRLFLRTEGPAFPIGSRLRLFGAQEMQSEIDLATTIDASGYWTDIFPLGRVRMVLVTGDGPVAPSSVLVIDSIAYQGTGIIAYSAHEGSQLIGINAPTVPDAVRRLAGPIAFLVFSKGGRNAVCTGFLIDTDLLMTNEHCINSAETCRSLTVAFGYESDSAGIQIGKQYRCLRFEPLLSSYELDVTVIRLNGNAGDEYGKVDLSRTTTDLSGPLLIIQHPGDIPKEVSIESCAMSAAPVDGRGPATDFTHTCDTAEGTSGAPILGVDGNFRGLHHFGFKDDDSDIWSENRGVEGGLIRNWLADALAATDQLCCTNQADAELPLPLDGSSDALGLGRSEGSDAVQE